MRAKVRISIAIATCSDISVCFRWASVYTGSFGHHNHPMVRKFLHFGESLLFFFSLCKIPKKCKIIYTEICRLVMDECVTLVYRHRCICWYWMLGSGFTIVLPVRIICKSWKSFLFYSSCKIFEKCLNNLHWKFIQYELSGVSMQATCARVWNGHHQTINQW
jgi:hypothetical protein